MNCFTHPGTAAVGVCGVCQRGVCRDCVAHQASRIICTACASKAVLGYEYKSAASFGGWPLVHVCMGVDPVTMRPKVARGVIAIGNMAIGGLAVGGLALGLFSLGGLSIGILAALGGAAVGLGLSLGGLAVGSVAIGGLAVGFSYALGGAAFAPEIINGLRCDPAARDFLLRLGAGSLLPPHCG